MASEPSSVPFSPVERWFIFLNDNDLYVLQNPTDHSWSLMKGITCSVQNALVHRVTWAHRFLSMKFQVDEYGKLGFVDRDTPANHEASITLEVDDEGNVIRAVPKYAIPDETPPDTSEQIPTTPQGTQTAGASGSGMAIGQEEAQFPSPGSST